MQAHILVLFQGWNWKRLRLRRWMVRWFWLILPGSTYRRIPINTVGARYSRDVYAIYIYIHISLTIHMNHFVQSICNQVVGVSLRWNNARPKYEDPSDLHTLSDLADSTVKMWNKFSPGSWGRFELRCVNMWSKACPCIQGSKWTRSVISFRYGPTPRLPRCSWYFLPAIVGH